MLSICTIPKFCWLVNTLPNGKILDQSNLKVFADDILNIVQRMIFVTDWVENIEGNGGNVV